MLMKTLPDTFKRIGTEGKPTATGARIFRLFLPSERYEVDFADDFHAEGWLQFDTDQDAHYFGTWVNPRRFLTLSYTEGDWTLTDCGDRECYLAQIRRMIDFHRPGYIAKVIGDDGSMIVCEQDRSQFLADEPDLLTVGDVIAAVVAP